MTDQNATSKHVPNLDELSFFIGHWLGSGQFHATPFGAQKAIGMRVVGTLEDRGKWIMIRTEELEAPDNTAPLTARYLWGPSQDGFAAEWFDSNGGRATQRSAGWDGNTFVLLGEMTLNGFTVPLRDTFKRTSADSYHHIGETDLGEGWIAVDEESFTRVPDPPFSAEAPR